MFIYGNIPQKKIQPKLLNQKKSWGFIYMLVQGDSECENKPGKIFSDYAAARRTAMAMVKRRNSLHKNLLDVKNDSENDFLTEMAPDHWVNGHEWIRINIMEIKNS